MFPECVQNRFCPEIIGVPLGRQVGVTFWPCWCAEFHAGEHPRTKVGATTAGACIYIYICIFMYMHVCIDIFEIIVGL